MKRFPISSTALLTLALGLGVSTFVPALPAAGFTPVATGWLGSTGDWTVSSNWTNGVPIAHGTSLNYGVFNGQGATSVTNAQFISMEFDSGDYTINFVSVVAKGLATGPITVNAGTQTFNGVQLQGTQGSNSAGVNSGPIFNVAAGATLNIGNNLSTIFGGLTFTGSGTVNVSGNLVGGGGSVTKSGTGTTTFSGTNSSETATTTINGGKLLVNGLVSATSGTYTVNSGGTLGGFGTINHATTINSGGILAPGVGQGVLTFGGALTLASGSLTNFDINGTTRGTDYDGLNVGGLTSYGGTLTLNFGSSIQGGNTLDLLQLTGGVAPSTSFSSILATGSYNGSFSDSGGIWSLSAGGQTFTFDQSTGDLTVTATAVPEPATCAALAGAAALGFVACRRRRGGAANA